MGTHLDSGVIPRLIAVVDADVPQVFRGRHG